MVPVFDRMLAGRVSRADYAGLLAALRRFHVDAQPRLRRGYAVVALEPVDFVALLDADLASVGRSGSTVADAGTVITGSAEALGWVWVVEGSALGGQILHRALDSLFGDAMAGRSYYRPRTDFSRRWRTIGAAIETEARYPHSLDSMIAGALAAFASMETCLAGRP